MKPPKFIKFKSPLAKNYYQAVYRRCHLAIRGRYLIKGEYRIFFNGSSPILKDENGIYFKQFHRYLKDAKAEIHRVAESYRINRRQGLGYKRLVKELYSS